MKHYQTDIDSWKDTNGKQHQGMVMVMKSLLLATPTGDNKMKRSASQATVASKNYAPEPAVTGTPKDKTAMCNAASQGGS